MWQAIQSAQRHEAAHAHALQNEGRQAVEQNPNEQNGRGRRRQSGASTVNSRSRERSEVRSRVGRGSENRATG